MHDPLQVQPATPSPNVPPRASIKINHFHRLVSVHLSFRRLVCVCGTLCTLCKHGHVAVPEMEGTFMPGGCGSTEVHVPKAERYLFQRSNGRHFVLPRQVNAER